MQTKENAFSVFIRISYRPPSALIYLIFISHFGAVCSIYYAVLPLIAALSCTALVLASFVHSIAQFRQMKRRACAPQICLTRKNEWLIVDEGTIHKVKLKPAALVHPCLVILRFTSELESAWCFILNRENVEKNTFRRLRVRLLYGKTNI